MAKELSIFFCGFPDARYGLSRDDEQMGGGLRVDVAQDDAVVILMNEVTGYFPFDDFRK